MFKLLKTIKSIFKSKVNNINKKLQMDNCIDLVKEQQLKMAQSYKRTKCCISDLKLKIEKLKNDIKNEKNESLRVIKEKNLKILSSSLTKLIHNKEILSAKLKNTVISRDVLKAKKDLLDSIEDIKKTSSNILENENFDVDNIMEEIDSTINRIETEIECDMELNDILK